MKKFYAYQSITYLDNIAPELDILNEIYNLLLKIKSCLVSDIINKISYDKTIILKSVLWLSKYGYVNIENRNDEK